ncbi:MAG: hypothetical protein OXC37_02450 [Bdellovibrionaceae bacterium]|nr:hypothetical protein [Pseudobdellovibrionaceae bacterium]
MIFNKKAFSLIEILSSILLLSSLIGIIVQLSYGNNKRVKKSRQLRQIAMLLELKMTELQQEFQGENIINLPATAQGQFADKENYFWSYQTQPLQLPDTDLLLSLMNLPDNELNNQMLEVFKSVLSDTVIELKLTVNYQIEKEFEYSLSAYFINYNEAPDFILNYIKNIMPQGQGAVL